jgi:hypothetical protein
VWQSRETKQRRLSSVPLNTNQRSSVLDLSSLCSSRHSVAPQRCLVQNYWLTVTRGLLARHGFTKRVGALKGKPVLQRTVHRSRRWPALNSPLQSGASPPHPNHAESAFRAHPSRQKSWLLCSYSGSNQGGTSQLGKLQLLV